LDAGRPRSASKGVAKRVQLAQPTVFWERHMKLGVPELLIILAIVILIFGASRLPELGKGIGRGIKNFKESSKGGGDDK
jgi:sec-independent protein translocase protein TatA